MKYKLLVVGLLLVTLVLQPLGGKVSAAINQGRIIDDAIFDNANAMTAAQIDSFLNSFPYSCISTNSGFKAIDPTGYNPTQGFLYGGFVSAGKVIYDAAQAYGINPQVLLTTLQKEQSLVVGAANFCNNGDQNKYAAAVGYGCPDGGTVYNYTGLSLYQRNGTTVTSTGSTCVNTAEKAGFTQQIIRGAWLLKFGEQRSQGNINWAVIKGNWDNSDDPQTCYGGPMTQGTWARCPSGGSAYYDGYITIDGTSVHLYNGATASLYWYTPHFSGNQHFSDIFTGWFGPPVNDAYAWALLQDSSTGKIYLQSNRTVYWVPGPAYMTAWGLDKLAPTSVTTSYINNFTIGPNLTYVGLDINGTRYLMSAGERYTLTSDSAVLDWGVAGITHISAPGYVAQLPSGGNAGRFATDATSGTTYLLDGTQKHAGLNTQSLSYWGQNSSDTTTVTSDILARLPTGPAVDRYISAGGKDMIIDQSTALTFKNADIEAAWGSHSYVAIGPYAPNMIAQTAATNFILDTTDSRWYYLEGGNRHYISSSTMAQLWGWGASNRLTNVSDALVSQLTTSTNLSYIATTSDGSVYIVDGSKHLVGNTYVPLWEGGQIPPTFSTNAFNLLPTGIALQTISLGFTNNPRIFTIDNGQLRYITGPTILDAMGGNRNNPVAVLNPALSNFLSQGAALGTTFLQTAPGTTYSLESGYKYTLDQNSLSTWGATSPATVSASYLSAFTDSGKTLKDAISISGTKYLVNSQTLLNVSSDFDNYGLAASDFVPIVQSYFPVRQTSSMLVGTPASGKIWLLSMGKRYYVSSPALLYDLGYGSRFGIVSLSPDIINTLPEQSGSATHLLKAPNSGTIFVSVGNGYGFRDSTTLSDYSAGQTFTVSAAYFNRIPFVGWTSQLVAGVDGKVYAVSGGQKHWVTGPSLLAKYYAGQQILWLPQNTINALPTGTAITS